MIEPSRSEFIAVGRILAPQGLAGKLKVEVTTDFPRRFAPGARVFVREEPLTIDGVEWRREKVILKLRGIDERSQAEALQNQVLEIPQGELQPLPEGSYYHFQLVGLEVWTTGGKRLGRITRVLSAPGNDNYLVDGADGEILIPAIEDVVKEIDLDKGRVTIEPLTGLLDLNEKKG
jgi:16S rRNA processing protein RimM